MRKRPSYVLPFLVLAQFAGTSLWFAGNAILPDLQRQLHLHGSGIGNITSAVQLGFITGTLLFSIFSIADRFSPTVVFFISALIGALANVAIAWIARDTMTLFVLRFATGIFLAGIYPVGMKIASDWYVEGLGTSLGYLVGALVIGTAFPYLLKSNLYLLPARDVLYFTSVFATIGGLLVLLFVGNGPFRRAGSRFQPSVIIKIFKSADFRSAAFGYFGHMWELYTFWAFLPLMLALSAADSSRAINVALWSFIVIAVGGVGCMIGGSISRRIGSSGVAFYALLCSGACCLCSFMFYQLPVPLFLGVMIIWGMAVAADSPQFSTLVAQISVPEYKGTALTIVTCIGFAITIGSIQLMNLVVRHWPNNRFMFVLLAPGPLIGLLFLTRLFRKR